MRTYTFYAFAAALLAFGFAGPASAEGEGGCTGGYKTQSVEISTPDNSVAEDATNQSTKPGSGG